MYTAPPKTNKDILPNEIATPDTIAPDLDAIRAHLHLLYGEAPDGWLTLCTFGPAQVAWHPTSDLDAAAHTAATLAGHHDMYCGVGLRAEPLPGTQRGGGAHVAGIPGLWVDVDVAGPAHHATNLPPTTKDALDLIAAFPLPPTLVLDTGHGLQAYWCFLEPWIFDDDTERAEAQQLAGDFHRTMYAAAQRHGWTLDNTSDLARVMRLAGTLNWKNHTDPRPVSVLYSNPERRYDPDDFGRYLLAPAPICPPPLATPTPLNLDDAEILRRALRREPTARLYAGDLSVKGGDWNRCDLALVNAFLRAGATPEQALTLWRTSALWRPKGDEAHRGDGATYAMMTMERAMQPPTPVPAPPSVEPEPTPTGGDGGRR